MRSEISIAVDDSDPRDPTALCDRCARQGTIARAVHHTDPPSVLRYCGDCWPVAQEELKERQRDEQKQWVDAWIHNPQGARPAPPSPPGWSSASRSWYDVRSYLALIAQPPNGGPAPTPSQLAETAAQIRAAAIEMDGPMPPDVEEFITRHLPPSV